MENKRFKFHFFVLFKTWNSVEKNGGCFRRKKRVENQSSSTKQVKSSQVKSEQINSIDN